MVISALQPHALMMKNFATRLLLPALLPCVLAAQAGDDSAEQGALEAAFERIEDLRDDVEIIGVDNFVFFERLFFLQHDGSEFGRLFLEFFDALVRTPSAAAGA